ncbi:sigma-70 family RNA polymerase sigma factor [Intestinibacter sp.]|uniref:sigma-70 family RNA polymerase sigma factor n=1 Tax=Intestinibacter sp. TaxID=1965304 RepID=UPI002A756E30|nr:sigma-70 family RNA polymerase sigma factor [Intestinibacter sp.]MDY2738162.1 sigma-70 family RNA polymerase sigma factor [Intestinibacter sp.]
MEKKMIKKIRKKDPKGLDYMIKTYSKNVYFLVNKIIGYYGKEEVEECVSDVFFKVWEDIDKFDEARGSFSSFIFIKAKYLALDYKRKLEKNHLASSEIDDNISNNKLPEHEVLDKETSREIIEVIKSFKEPDKTYFYHKYFMYYKIDEIAQKFGVTSSSIENRLYRCRLIIKDFLERRA